MFPTLSQPEDCVSVRPGLYPQEVLLQCLGSYLAGDAWEQANISLQAWGKHQDLENLAGVVMMGLASHIPDAFDMWSVLDTSRGT